MALNFPVDQSTLGFSPPNWLGNPNLMYGLNPDQQAVADYNNPNLPMWKRVGLQAPPTPDQTQQAPSQQPTIPINTAQGAPQRLQSTPNSPPLVGGFANNALGAGGNGYPMGGLPTQSPMTELWQFNQAQSAPAQTPIAGPANPMFRMQQHQANLQRLQQYLSRLGGYSFQG